jgi:hypothetical protein
MTSSLSIDIPAVTDLKDVDAALSFQNGISNTVITLPDAIAFLGRKLFTTRRSGISFGSFDTFENAPQVLLRNLLQFFDCRPLQAYLIFGHLF